MTDLVSRVDQGQVAVITINNPPVNALGHGVRAGLIELVAAADEDPAVKAIVIAGGGRTFPAGADITEFNGEMKLPGLPEVINRIEACTKPTLAAIHGTALGGGFEITLGCHYRIADAQAKVGLPEIHIGVFPGAGGTQRLPRIAGMGPTLDMMIKGAPVPVTLAQKFGVIDRVSEGGELAADALAYAQEIIDQGLPARPTSARAEGLADQAANQQALQAARAAVAKLPKRLMAHDALIDCVSQAGTLSLDDGLALERKHFVACMQSDEAKGLIHAFFAERQSAKVPEAGRAKPRALESLGVIGGGTMGGGITCAALDAGLPVIMVERDEESLAKGRHNVEKVYARHVERGRMTPEKAEAVLANYSATTDMSALGEVDMVIEAVFERLDVKQGVFEQLDKVAKPGAVLASNTSYLDIDKLAAVTSRPQDVIGLHFFSPANIMKLLEIVIPGNPSDDAVATGFQLAKMMRKVPVRAGNCDGFIGNRVLGVYAQAAMYMVEDGASPYDIDRVMVEFGYPMGPFSMFDLAGGDIGWDTRKRKAATRSNQERYVHIADRLCENGWFGQKTGRGWYRYEPGARRGTPDPEVLAIIDEERAKRGITPRTFSDEEILARYMAAMINEGANCIDDGTALKPSDVDVTKLYGYAFPRWRGGPMHYADSIGLDTVLGQIEAYAAEDAYFWQPSPLLKRLVEEGKTFADLNRTA